MSSNRSSTSSSEWAELVAYTYATLRPISLGELDKKVRYPVGRTRNFHNVLRKGLVYQRPTPPWDCCFPSWKCIRWSDSRVIVSSPSLHTSHNPTMSHLIFSSSTSSWVVTFVSKCHTFNLFMTTFNERLNLVLFSDLINFN